MLQRVLAALLCLLGAAAIGLAVASATVWRASDTLTASASAASGSTLLTTAPGVLDMAADEVTVRAEGDDVVIALGTAVDVEGWVGEDPHTVVTGLTDLTTLSTTDVPAGGAAAEEGAADEAPASEAPGEAEEPAGEAPEETAAPESTEAPESTQAPADDDATAGTDEGTDAPAATTPPDPTASDLWHQVVTGDSSAELPWLSEPGRWSVLVASTGEGAQPPTVTLTWPQEVTTPWLVPGIAVGSVLLLAGAGWLALLLLRGRRTRRQQGVATEDLEPAAAAAVGAPAPRAGTAPVVGAAVSPAAGEGTGPVAGAPLTRRQIRELERTGQVPVVTGPVPTTPAPAAGPPVLDETAGTSPVGPTRPADDPVTGPAGGPERRADAPTTGHVAPRAAAEPSRPADGRHAAGPALGSGIVPAAPPGRHAPPPGAHAGPSAGRPARAWDEAPAPRTSPVPPPPAGAPSGSSSDVPDDVPDDVAPARRSRLAARFRRRPQEGGSPDVPEGSPGRAPDGPAAPQSPAPEEPVWTPRPGQHGPNASADAWRRAWGFTPPPAGAGPESAEDGAGGHGTTDSSQQEGGAR